MSAIDRIAELVGERYGLNLDPLSEATLHHRLSERAAATKVDGLDGYLALLERTPSPGGEWEELLDLITVHETYFFRDESQMEALREETLPALAKSRKDDARLRILSAGCSTGEEAYSLAILVRESHLFEGWDVAIHGTDVSQRCVKSAKHATYRPASFRLPNPAPHAFTRVNDRMKVNEPYTSICDFRRHNLLEPMPLVPAQSYDLILCRNVLLYFREEARPRLVGHLARYLRDDGWLFLGHAETLPKEEKTLASKFVRGALAYRRAPVRNSDRAPVDRSKKPPSSP